MAELVPSIGVSATLIAAACKEHKVPTPPRGYWSKVRAGKPTSRMPLPTRPPGMANYIRIGRPRSDAVLSPPEFVMSIEDLRSQVSSAVRTSQHIPKTQRTAVKRLKRIWLALSNSLAIFGGAIIPKVDEPMSAIIQVYHQSIFVNLQVCDGIGNEEHGSSASSLLVLTMYKQGRTKEPAKIFKDAEDAALEAKLQEIITEIVVLAEIKERDAQTARYAWQVAQRKQNRINQLEREAQRQKDAETQSTARLSSLLRLAKRHEQANTLRKLLAEVDVNYPSVSDLEIQRWRSIVAAEIERLDPLVDKRFLTVLGNYTHSSEVTARFRPPAVLDDQIL